MALMVASVPELQKRTCSSEGDESPRWLAVPVRVSVRHRPFERGSSRAVQWRHRALAVVARAVRAVVDGVSGGARWAGVDGAAAGVARRFLGVKSNGHY